MIDLSKTLSIGEVMHLRDRHVEEIIIRYSGGGDSGQIDEVVYSSEKFKEEASEKDLGILQDIHDKLESIGYYVLEDIGDWYNNEGGQGVIRIFLPELNYDIQAEFNPEEQGTYDEETHEWIPDNHQDSPWEEYYEGYLEKE
jgi:hypothetical protein